jgi:hypothetical protein
MRLNFTIALLLMAVGAAPAADPKPSEEEAARLLEQVRQTALNYTSSLPDFICTQVVRRYVDSNGRDRWALTDTLTVKLSYFGQKEDYKLLLIDNKPTNLEYMKAGGASSKGEFGTILKLVFDSASATGFQWKSWSAIRKRRAAVYSYHVERAHSAYVVSVQMPGDNLRETVVGFHGEIFVDRDTKMVLRMTTVADLPLGFPMKQSSTTLDYDFTEVGGREYLLPLNAEVEMRSTGLHTKNNVAFHSYQKFQSETTISFKD